MPTELSFQSDRTYGCREANTIALLQSTNIHVTVLLTHKLPSIKKKATNSTHTHTNTTRIYDGIRKTYVCRPCQNKKNHPYTINADFIWYVLCTLQHPVYMCTHKDAYNSFTLPKYTISVYNLNAKKFPIFSALCLCAWFWLVCLCVSLSLCVMSMFVIAKHKCVIHAFFLSTFQYHITVSKRAGKENVIIYRHCHYLNTQSNN